MGIIDDLLSEIKEWHDDYTGAGEARCITQLKADVEAARATLKEIKLYTDRMEELVADARELRELVAEAWQGDSGEEMVRKIWEWMDNQGAAVGMMLRLYNRGIERLDRLEELDSALAQTIRNS